LKEILFLFEKGQIYRCLYGWVARVATLPYTTGLKLAANSLPIPQLPIHSLEVCCQFVSFKKLINLFQPLKSLPYTIAKTVSCAHAQRHGANAQSTVDLLM